MSQDISIPRTVQEAKTFARQLKKQRADLGELLPHSKALEITAHLMGFSNWNIASAHLKSNSSFLPQIGDRVSGHYLKQAFVGTIVQVKSMASTDQFEVSIDFDTPVDVVSFESFSAFRKRVTALLDKNGICPRRTSDGAPHMVLDAFNCQII